MGEVGGELGAQDKEALVEAFKDNIEDEVLEVLQEAAEALEGF